MRNVSDKSCRENKKKKTFKIKKFFFFSKKMVVFKKMWKNILKPAMP